MKSITKSFVTTENKSIRSLSVIFLSAVLFFSCSSPRDGSDIINYSSLKELSTEVILTIGESEDYMPGRIRDLKVTQDGAMLVGDLSTITIEQFDSTGKHVGTIARAGRGPGELSDIFLLHILNGDTLIARNRSGRKDYFAPAENGEYSHFNTTVQGNHSLRTLDIVKPVAEDTLYGIKENMEAVYNNLENPKPIIREAFVVTNESEKIVNDSVHVLKRTGRFSVELESGGYLSTPFRFQINEQAVPLQNGRYLITRPDSNAFFIYNNDHNLERRIPVNVKKRPITDEDIEYEVNDLPDNAASIVKKNTPEFKPPYRKVFASDSYFWLLTGESKAGKEVVVLDYDGAPVGKFMLPVHDRIAHVEDGRIYTINRNPERGNKIHVYKIGLDV